MCSYRSSMIRNLVMKGGVATSWSLNSRSFLVGLLELMAFLLLGLMACCVHRVPTERIAIAEVKTLDSQRLWVAGHLPTLRLKMPDFQPQVGKDVENGFTELRRRLMIFKSSLMFARRRGIDNAINESLEPLQEVMETFKINLTDTVPLIGYIRRLINKIFLSEFVFTALYCLVRADLEKNCITWTVGFNIGWWSAVVYFWWLPCIFFWWLPMPAYFIQEFLRHVTVVHKCLNYIFQNLFARWLLVLWNCSLRRWTTFMCYILRQVILCRHWYSFAYWYYFWHTMFLGVNDGVLYIHDSKGPFVRYSNLSYRGEVFLPAFSKVSGIWST